MNVICLEGRLVADPELKRTQNDLSVTNFCLAVDRSKDVTDFFNCVAWKQLAEYITRYGAKGLGVTIDGILTTRKYTDKNNIERTAYEIVCNHARVHSKGTTDEMTVIDDAKLPF